MTTHACGLLLRETGGRLNRLTRWAECLVDRRRPNWVRHSMRQLVAQRVDALALGYADHEQLRTILYCG